MENIETTNIAETLAREMKTPIEIISEPGGNFKRVALPPGWTLQEKDDDAKLLAVPRRKKARVDLRDPDSFIAYVKRHGSLTDSTISRKSRPNSTPVCARKRSWRAFKSARATPWSKRGSSRPRTGSEMSNVSTSMRAARSVSSGRWRAATRP